MLFRSDDYMKNESVEEPSEDEIAGLSAEEQLELKRLTQLIRLGLMDKQKLMVVLRALKKLESDVPVTSMAEKQALFTLLQNLIGIVTDSNAMFQRVRFAVAHNK